MRSVTAHLLGRWSSVCLLHVGAAEPLSSRCQRLRPAVGPVRSEVYASCSQGVIVGVVPVARTGRRSIAARRADALWLGAGGVIAAGLVLWLARRSFGPELVAGGDMTAHLVRADFGIDELVAHGRLDGWIPRFGLGQPEFLFNGPGVTWLMALLRAVTFGQLSNAGALKVLALGSLALFPLAVVYAARALGLDERASVLAGILSIAASSGYGLGFEGMFVNGLLSHQVGAIAMFVAFGALLRCFDVPDPRTMLLAAAALGALIVTHLVSLLALGILLPTALVFRSSVATPRARWTGFARVAGASMLAVALVAFWVLPFVAHRDLRGPVTTWATDPLDQRIAAVFRGQLLFHSHVAKLVALSWLVLVVLFALGRRRHTVLLAMPVVYLLVAHVAIVVPGPNEVTMQLANRGLGYVGVLALLPLALLLVATIDLVVPPGSARRVRVGVVPELVALLLVVAIVLAYADDDADHVVRDATPEFRSAAETVRVAVPDGARVAVTRDFPDEIGRTGVVEPARWMAWASGRDVLNPFNPEASSAAGLGFRAGGPGEDEPTDDWVRSLRALGVSHVVVITPSVDEALRGGTLTQEVWRSGEISIHAVRADDGSAPPVLLDAEMPVQAELERQSPERLAWAVDADDETVVRIPIAWSPLWEARIDGEPVRLVRTDDDRLQLTVPRGQHRLALSYGADRAQRLGVVLSLLTLGALAVAVVARGWSRRRSEERVRSEGTQDPGPAEPASEGWEVAGTTP